MFGEDGILANEKRTEKARVVSSKALIYSLSREVDDNYFFIISKINKSIFLFFILKKKRNSTLSLEIQS